MEVKNKKMIICLIITLALAFMAGCDDSENVYKADETAPFEMYTDIQKRVDELSSIEAQLTTSFFINNGVESLELGMTSDMKQIGNRIIGADVEIITSTRYLDQTLTVTSYYTDGYYYTDYNGEKIKYKFSNEDMMEENHLALPEIEEAYIKESSLVFDAENNAEITLKVDSSVFLDMAEDLIDNFTEADLDFFNCSDMTIVVKADEKGNIKSCDYLISMNTTEKGITTEYTIDAYIEYLSINKKIEIEFPDFTEYTEIYKD